MTDFKNKSGPKAGFSRRAFLRGSGAAAAVTALHGQGAAVAEEQGSNIVAGETAITLNVNGKDEKVKAESSVPSHNPE